MTDDQNVGGEEQSVEAQAQEQTGRQVRLRFDERNRNTAYANAFRSSATAEEVILDFGLNQVMQAQGQAGEQASQEILFEINDRVILNYYTAKRLAITLGQIIRRHEDQFGELKLNVADRAAAPAGA